MCVWAESYMIHPAGDLDVTQASADYRRRTHIQPPYSYASHIQCFHAGMVCGLCQKSVDCIVQYIWPGNCLWFVLVFSACVISLSCILCLRYPGEQIWCLEHLKHLDAFLSVIESLWVLSFVLCQNSKRYLIEKMSHSICVSQSNLTSTKVTD